MVGLGPNRWRREGTAKRAGGAKSASAAGSGATVLRAGGRRGAQALSPLDRDSAASFLEAYKDRPSQPLAVVIAAYNEEANVAQVVSAVPDVACSMPTEVIVVVDGASDNTAEVARQAGALVCDVGVNRGQGAALRLGYHLARERGASIIATTDADGQWDPADIPRVVQPIVDDEADFVSASRRLGSTASTDLARNLGVVVFGKLISLLTGQKVTDPSCGLRAMRAGVTSSVVLDQPQYQASELLIGAAMAGYKLAEVPTFTPGRRSGTTKKGGDFVYGLRFGAVVLRTWLRDIRRATNTQRS